ncbi:multicopper oxidase domain-containing protein [Paeniglutamicibacter psychrophenolicus]|uniref:Copper-containing nitrite reductase n=1 Tax=Paeniglutamicibacter psychrophenolicus TaxID=257454 RepID=A0ABS4WAZ2_9MICC|nr:multicopper oxidase domain-containing protein [Paeniglutamicibacter psychrophenolicus]MBP2373370.1 nitrite reductase (NO-forming) [Paeniglutamicibacter psychrophenolicus]
MSKNPARGFWPMRDLPVAFWLVLLVVATLVHRQIPAPRWLMIHLLLLGAISHAILVWSQYFAIALLRTPARPHDRATQNWRLLMLNAGTVVVVAGVLSMLWPLTATGAALVAGAVIWHGVDLFARMRRALPSRFGATVKYYIAAAAFLPVGAVLGTVLAHGTGSPTHEQVTLAHAFLNVLGWVGLTVAGTLVTLWPTMLRTRIADQAAVNSRRALPVLIASALAAALGAGFGLLPVAAAGLLGYIAGLGMMASAFIQVARNKPPKTFSTLSVLGAVSWWIGCLVALVVSLLGTGDWQVVGRLFASITPYLVAGFAAQVLLGALSYLVPVVLGGGPAPVRAATTVLDRGAVLRVSTANAALLVCALPVPSLVRVLCSGLYLVAMASFLPLLFMALRAHRGAKAKAAAGFKALGLPAGTPAPRVRLEPEGERPAGQRAGQAMAGLIAVVLAIAVGVAIDPAASGIAAPPAPPEAGTAAPATTAQTMTVKVQAADMGFTPASIEVPAGTHLVIELTNTDAAETHDLVLATGANSGRLAPGQSATVDAGVITSDVSAWCSIVGHRQMGMVLEIKVAGTPAAPGEEPGAADPGHGSMHQPASQAPSAPGAPLDLMAEPDASFTAHDASLPALPPRPKDGKPVVHQATFTAQEAIAEVSPGVRQKLWTFNGTAPGPLLHGRVGDRFEITLVNDGTMGHSIDFHAGALAPDEPMRTIQPGESLLYTFTATRAGIWMYHCSTMPMSAHIANGMFGTVVIEPEGLPEVDRSYVLAQSEFYLGAQDAEIDTGKLAAEKPDLVVFNGYANQYVHRPLPARVGERVRIWLLDVGPNRASSFHVIGGQFDTTWFEGNYLLDDREGGDGGSQALALGVAQGGFVELQFPEAGNYPFVSHVMVDAERGAQGVFKVAE